MNICNVMSWKHNLGKNDTAVWFVVVSSLFKSESLFQGVWSLFLFYNQSMMAPQLFFILKTNTAPAF